jgi:hypothetical protein
MATSQPDSSPGGRWKKLATAVKSGDAVQKENLFVQQDMLVTEIEATDGSMATALR